jgi:hypothetical protein
VTGIARLDNLRLGAAGERIDALLHLDRAGEVVAELDSLVRRFPVRSALQSSRCAGCTAAVGRPMR